VGAVMGEALRRVGLSVQFDLEGINHAILRNLYCNADYAIIDDLYMGIGKIRIVRFQDYKKGHNAVKFLRGNYPKGRMRLLLIGCRTDSDNLSELSEYMEQVNRIRSPL
jgi:hypothetical protein